MMIFKKVIPRRTFLRGLGATLALPLLDGMIPAFASTADAAAKPAVRLGVVYVPNGIIMQRWTPKAEGAAFEMTPTLEMLAPFRDQLLVLSGFAHKEAVAIPGEGPQEHSRACATYLTGVRAKMTAGKDIRAGKSLDQIVADEVGKQTQLASLEVSLCATELVGLCETDYSCTYVNTLSWRNPTTPLPMENNPRAVFERLFGDSDNTDSAARLALIQSDRSILDRMASNVASLLKNLGPSDRGKITQYLDAIRDVERRIQIAEKQASRELPKLEKPLGGIPGSYEEYAKLMFDLQVVAFQSDLTRVITFMMGREGPFGGRSYPELGITDLHHTLSHHQGDAAKIAKVIEINLYQMRMFAYYVEKLRATPDGDGSLLDHSIIVYGSGLGDGNIHAHVDLPALLVGGGAGQLKGGRHIRYPDGTPMTNLHLTLLDKLGLRMDKFGDSTGKLPELLSV